MLFKVPDNPCPMCNGIGFSVNKNFLCYQCGGSGNLRHIKTDCDQVCDVCNGTGLAINNDTLRCKYCNGKGYRDWIDEMVRPFNQ